MVHTPSIRQWQQLCFPCHLCSTISTVPCASPLLYLFFFLSSLPYSHATITKLQQKSPRPVSIRSERALLQLNQYLQFTNEEMAGPERLRTLLCFRLGESSLASFLLVPYSCYPACWCPGPPTTSLFPFIHSVHAAFTFIFLKYFSHHLSLSSTKFWWSLLLGRL